MNTIRRILQALHLAKRPGAAGRSFPQTISLNPLAHLTEDELVGGMMGTFTGHVDCADCFWIAKREGRTIPPKTVVN